MFSTSSYSLRLLGPVTDVDLYREAYSWRKPKRHTQPDRMPFEEFSAVNDTQLTIGLFNGELRAVYHLIETEPSIYEAHFTTQRGLTREIALLGARETARLLLENGASRIDAWVTLRSPLRSFLEDLGFHDTGVRQFSLQSDTGDAKLSPDAPPEHRSFIKYELKEIPQIGSFGSKTNFHSE